MLGGCTLMVLVWWVGWSLLVGIVPALVGGVGACVDCVGLCCFVL